MIVVVCRASPKRQALAGEEDEEEEQELQADDEDPTAAERADEQEVPPESAHLDEGQDNLETAEDRAFIDDADVAPEERYGSDVEGDAQARQDEEAEEVVEDELDAIFAKGKRKKAVRYVFSRMKYLLSAGLPSCNVSSLRANRAFKLILYCFALGVPVCQAPASRPDAWVSAGSSTDISELRS